MDTGKTMLLILTVVGEISAAKVDGVLGVDEMIAIIRKAVAGLGFGGKTAYKGDEDSAANLEALHVVVSAVASCLGKGVSENLMKLILKTTQELKTAYADMAITWDELIGIVESVARNSRLGALPVYRADKKPVLSALWRLGGMPEATA